MRLFGRHPNPAPACSGDLAFLDHISTAIAEARATQHFAQIGGFAFALALDDALRERGMSGQFHAAEWGGSVVTVVEGHVVDHTGHSRLVAQEPVTREALSGMAVGPVYARAETLERDRRWAAKMIAAAQARATAAAERKAA